MAINSRTTSGANRALIGDIISLLTLVGGISCCHISRDINKTTHSLAKMGLDFSHCITGDDSLLCLLMFIWIAVLILYNSCWSMKDPFFQKKKKEKGNTTRPNFCIKFFIPTHVICNL
ncbi:hypothetical protein PanWU01x14_002280, partial [Parasponia andersonii]